MAVALSDVASPISEFAIIVNPQDNVAVVKVAWSDSLGNTGSATGTTAWQTAAIPIRVGANTITIRAYDAAGNSGWRSVTVTRN